MKQEREAEIVSDAEGRGAKMAAMDEGFRQAAGRNPKAEAKAEYAEYVNTIHGKRERKVELERIEREILDEREADWRRDVEQTLGWLDYAHSQELPTLEQHVRECEAPQSAEEAYEAAVSDRGSSDRPLMLALLEGVTRRDIRVELSRMGPAAALELYKRAVPGNGVSSSEVVKRAVTIQEIERRSTWVYDAKGPNAAAEHAASLELQKLIAATKASRVPAPLREALDRAHQARRFADRLKQILKLQPATPAELFGDGEVRDRYKGHPRIQRALKRGDE